MKFSFEALTMIMLGLFGMAIIYMFETVTINNESSYYILKEAMQAAMYESIDYGYYSMLPTEDNKGEFKISEQKFVENFTRRFAASINDNANNYTLEFYDIIEKPPKVTVLIKSNTNVYTGEGEGDNQKIVQSSADLENNLTGILEVYENS